MRLEKMRDAELARRKGSTRRTILTLFWLAFCFVAAYYLVNWLVDEGYIAYASLYAQGIPRSVPEWAMMGAIMLAIVLLMQFFLILGYFFGSPTGRQATGVPTATSRDPDPLDEHHH